MAYCLDAEARLRIQPCFASATLPGNRKHSFRLSP